MLNLQAVLRSRIPMADSGAAAKAKPRVKSVVKGKVKAKVKPKAKVKSKPPASASSATTPRPTAAVRSTPHWQRFSTG